MYSRCCKTGEDSGWMRVAGCGDEGYYKKYYNAKLHGLDREGMGAVALRHGRLGARASAATSP